MKDKDIYDLLKEYKFDFSKEVEEPINDLDKKILKKLVRLKIEKEENNKRKNIKQILITALITLIIILSFSPIGKKVIAEIKEKLFFNPGLGVVSIEEEIYILEKPLVLDANKEVLIKSIASQKEGVSLDIWFESKGAKNLKDINKNVKLKMEDKTIIESESYYSTSGGEMDFASLYFKTNKILNEVTLIIYDKEIKITLEKPAILYGYDEVGATSFDNEILVGANKYFFDNKTYISLWSKELYEENEINYLAFDAENITVKDSDGKEYEVSSSSLSGNGREFFINGIVDRPLEVKINKLRLDYYIENPEVIKLDLPKENEVIEVNKEFNVKSLEKTFIVKEIKGIKNENGDAIETVIDLNQNGDNDITVMIKQSMTSSYGIGDEENKERIYGIYREDLSLKEKMFNKVYLKFNEFTIEKQGEWKLILK